MRTRGRRRAGGAAPVFVADHVIEDGDEVTFYARILPGPPLGQQDQPIMSVFILRDGLILSIESQPGISAAQFHPQPPDET